MIAVRGSELGEPGASGVWEKALATPLQSRWRAVGALDAAGVRA